jgi:hypothetical protein
MDIRHHQPCRRGLPPVDPTIQRLDRSNRFVNGSSTVIRNGGSAESLMLNRFPNKESSSNPMDLRSYRQKSTPIKNKDTTIGRKYNTGKFW